MVSLGNKNLENGFPTIAVGFKDDNSLEELKMLKLHKRLDVAEIRVDMFHDKSTTTVKKELEKFKNINIPTILTVRPKHEGGMWDDGEKERIDLISSCADAVDAIDIELSSIKKDHGDLISTMITNKPIDTKLIISHHNFDETPDFEELSDLVNDISAMKADLIKIACHLNTTEDLNTLTKVLLENADKNLIIIGMGDYGLLTRLSFPAYGSLLTFAYAKGMPTAPGQIHLDDMVESLRKMYPKYNQQLINDFEILEAV